MMKKKHNQHGQVLPIALMLLTIAALSTLVLFNTGQVANHKMRLANAADAAAYSGALWQARALNFQAYTNRAMVANQVSIAQTVALQSWALYGAVASENLATVLKPIPVINVISAGVETGFAALNQVISPLVKSLLPVVSLVNQGLSSAQAAVYAATTIATSDVIDTVVERSDNRFSIRTGFNAKSLSENLQSWRDFTARYDNQDIPEMRRKQKMINASLDEFSRQRHWEFFNFWFYSRPFLRHKVIRRGATRLNSKITGSGLEWQWQSEDTVSLHNKISRIGGSKRVEIPIGWAGVTANSSSSISADDRKFCIQEHDEYCQSVRETNDKASDLIDSGMPSPVKGLATNLSLSGYTGLQPYRSLSGSSMQQEDPRLKLTVEVAIPVDDITSAQAIGVKVSDRLPIVAHAESLSSLGSAEVYYQRPDEQRQPGVTLERAHGYSPYWQARLVAVTDQDKQLSLSLRSAKSSNPFDMASKTDSANAWSETRPQASVSESISRASESMSRNTEISRTTRSDADDLLQHSRQSLNEINSRSYQSQYHQALKQAESINHHWTEQ